MKFRKKRVKIAMIVALLLVILIPLIVMVVSKHFTAQEQAIRDNWSEEVSSLVGTDEEEEVRLNDAGLESDLPILRLVPFEIEEEGFTYYDTDVQDRLRGTLETLKEFRTDWDADAPLAVLNPYGTGSNGLYLYFTTDYATKISYKISVEDDSILDYSAVARDSSAKEYTKEHEFQIIGLVPGKTNKVTMTMTGTWGNVRKKVSFEITMPENKSGYPTQLEYTQGESVEGLSDGLYAMMRTNGYLGYGFFFDNEGVMRYEMVLEGYGLDRILDQGDGTILTCVSSSKLARMDGVGRVIQTYSLDGYQLHHDIQPAKEGKILALAEHEDTANVEDLVLEIDLKSGEVTELLDFKKIMNEYYEQETRPVSAADDFFWQAGEEDWIHLNTLQYMQENDSLVVSSRETSTIIKVQSIHNSQSLDWLVGDSAFWEDTAYADLCLTKEGDFVPQYGQHSVEYVGAKNEPGVYELRMYNNNFWSLNTRDYEADLDDSVGTELYGGEGVSSQVYIYEIDENERSYRLESSFEVPYSSIVSNAAPASNTDNWIVNSGMANVFGEYDSQGELIREYAYTCTMQGYRTFKLTMENFWFLEP